MPGWDETSVDDLLADPMVRDLMAADRVEASELKALLFGVQRTIERYATTHGGPASLAGFAQLYRSAPKLNPARPAPPANRGRSDLRKARMTPADHSRLSTAPRGCTLAGEARCNAGS
jgi:hypothetical protein